MGVTLWEMFSNGEDPDYGDECKEDFKKLLEILKDGKRLKCTDDCPLEVYHIMLRCWKDNARERPTFTQLRQEFEDMLKS